MNISLGVLLKREVIKHMSDYRYQSLTNVGWLTVEGPPKFTDKSTPNT